MQMTQKINSNSLIDDLFNDTQLTEQAVYLTLGDCKLCIRSNSEQLIEKLSNYFSHVQSNPDQADVEIFAIECDAPELGIHYMDWQREPGKMGRKDSYVDLDEARLVRKVRTGMVFYQSDALRIAAGPCLQNDNQVINFINSQYMNWLLQRGWLICHAAGLVYNKHGMAIAGFSGGGKSTLMLHLLENPEIRYLSNDRLFVKSSNHMLEMVGIPKLPRVNPGTIVHNPSLEALISRGERERLLALPNDQLWVLEDKYDVMIDEVYGPNRIAEQASLSSFLVLNWQRESTQPLQVKQIDLAQRQDLLAAIMKSPGVFYQNADGEFLKENALLDKQSYINSLKNINVYEVSGRIDFAALTHHCLALLTNS
jgi:HprK-related kinase B